MQDDEYSAIYVVKPQFLNELQDELQDKGELYGDLLFSKTRNERVCFAQDIFLEPELIDFSSISEAVSILKKAGVFWYLYPIAHVRRSKLIAEQLRHYKQLCSPFPREHEVPDIGVFALLDKNTLMFSTKRLRKWPNGACQFIEDKVNPPNRAYLKLWEALDLLNRFPKPQDSVLDLGASPGGWTYVMHSFGAEVTAVDKAPLAPKILQLPRVHSLQQSAFSLDPRQVATAYDWVLSDIACYPERSYELIKKWIHSGKAKQLIVTIKLQGTTDLNVLKKLKQIPNSYVTNLFYNKHEATFFYPYNAP